MMMLKNIGANVRIFFNIHAEINFGQEFSIPYLRCKRFTMYHTLRNVW